MSVRLVLLILGLGLVVGSYLPGCSGLLPAGTVLGLVGVGLPVLTEWGG